LLFLGTGMMPSRWADRHVQAMRRWVVWLAAGCLGVSAAAAGMLVRQGPLDASFVQWAWSVPLNLGVYFDSLAAVMLLLITFLGLIIARYSVRYLDGEAGQGRFLRWMAFTLGAVLLLVVARNLVLLTVAWMLTSFGLHQLLTHYADRPWAIWAARKKFLISRLGDVLLVAALGLTFQCFGSLDYVDVFAAARALHEGPSSASPAMALIGVLVALGAMTKSAQLPFHSWLPDTMETPTPVSALMHAGIINAGGFLVLRLSPLVSLSSFALDSLALVGVLTALFGAVVMLTQTSVKRALAFSTISQMGFMMLQCGLGAFSAALLHIVAHSVYKAHAFLSSGSVLESAARRKAPCGPPLLGARGLAALPAALVAALALAGSAGWLLGLDFAAKPGAAILGLILVIALSQLLWPALAAGTWRLAIQGIAGALLVSWGYYGAYLLVDRVFVTSVSHQITSPSASHGLVIAVVAVGFFAVFALQAVAGAFPGLPKLRALYVHAANGFYLNIPARRLTARVWGRSSPTP